MREDDGDTRRQERNGKSEASNHSPPPQNGLLSRFAVLAPEVRKF
jgi:hypothetical protein